MNTAHQDESDINPLNRRSAPRFSRQFTVGVEHGHNFFCQCRALNISSSGLRLVANQALAQGTRMNLTLCLDQNNMIEFEGEAVWGEALGSLGTHIMGIAFDPGQSASRGHLLRWMEDQGLAA